MDIGKNKMKLKILLLLIVSSFGLFAAEMNIEKIYAGVIENYKNITTFQADLVQTNYWKELDIEKESLGRIIYNEENLLLNYLDPAGQQMLVTKSSVTIYDSLSQNAMISDKTTELRPDKIIAEYWDKSQKEIKHLTATGVILLLTSDSEEIEILISHSHIVFFKLSDSSGNTVKYSFKNIVKNAELNDVLFQLQIPENVNIIDNRQ
jgi:outer membrane lipoprotein-sorting protein